MASRVGGKLPSPGRLIDPVIENTTNSARSLLGALRLRWRRMKSNAESYRALRVIQRSVPGFKEEEFKEQAKVAFVKTTRAAAAANLPELKTLCTGQYYSALRRGLETMATSSNRVEGVHVAAFVEEPKIIQARRVFMTPEPMRTWSTQPEFTQITVRFESRQVPVATADNDVLKRVRRKRGAAPSGNTAATWEMAFSKAGHPYYFTSDGYATWECPAQFGVVGVAPVFVRDTGAVRAPLTPDAAPEAAGTSAEDDSEASAATEGEGAGRKQARGRSRGARGNAGRGRGRTEDVPAGEERVVNYAVFERPMRPGGEWQLCHL